MVEVSLGTKTKTDELFKFDFPKNNASLVKKYLVLDKQGSGKTNLLMNVCYEMYRMYKDRKAKYGALPIIFSPLFEWSELSTPSKEQNIAPGRDSEELDCIQLTFEMAEPYDIDKFKIVAFDFKDLTIEDLASFVNSGKDTSSMGKIKKLIKLLVEGGKVNKDVTLEPNPEYTIDDFINLVEITSGVSDALYYVFGKLRDEGLFNIKKYGEFNWLEVVKEKKPLVFNFGEIHEEPQIQAIAGYLLRKLTELGRIYFKAFQKQHRIDANMTDEELTKDEKFLLKYFKIALFFEEAHRFLVNTTSTTLSSFPVLNYFRLISQQMGRKQGFKYNFLITQQIKFIYHGFRKDQDAILLGGKLGIDDREYLKEYFKLDEDKINALVNLPKFSFCIFYPDRYQNGLRPIATQFKAFRSPCGMPE